MTMKHLEKLTRKRLGEILLDEGLISKTQLADAERQQKRTSEPLGSILVGSSYVTEWDLARTVATQYQLPFVDIGLFSRGKEMMSLFASSEMRRGLFLPIDRIGPALTLAVAEMPEIDFLHAIEQRTGATPFLFVALLNDILTEIENGKAATAAAKSKSRTAAAPKAAGEQASLVAKSAADEFEKMVADAGEEDDGEKWEDIFDSANASILKEIDTE